MKMMYQAMPNFVPRPIAYGTYKEYPDAWFFLCEFRDLVDELPDVEEFSEMVAELHTRGANPGGKFGWPYGVFAGRNPRIYPESDSWEETFSQGLSATFDLEERVQGPDEEWSQLRKDLFEKVIPRLLRPLQTGGRSIVPTIVHGDLWHGNAAVDANTGQSIIFDPCGMFAHHEMELGPWYCPRHKIGKEYIKEYAKHRGPSEPEEDFEDRMRLYAV